jgi:hypothetical protein
MAVSHAPPTLMTCDRRLDGQKITRDEVFTFLPGNVDPLDG